MILDLAPGSLISMQYVSYDDRMLVSTSLEVSTNRNGWFIIVEKIDMTNTFAKYTTVQGVVICLYREDFVKNDENRILCKPRI